MRITGFDKLITRVRTLENNLAHPADFYQANRGRYHAQAMAIAEKIITALKPNDSSAADWQRKTRAVLGKVETLLFFDGRGIIFKVVDPGEPTDGSLAPKDERPDSQVMTFKDIKTWIQAGIDGEPGGKRITAIDDELMRDKGIEGVASIVMKAYYSKRADPRYTRLRAAIQRYFLGARKTESAPILDAIATAWREHFAVVIPRDLKRHAAELCRRF